MRYAAASDANQVEIVAALRAAGATVQDLHEVGAGCPDLLVGYRGINFLLEVKASARAILTAFEQGWFLEWRGQAAIVRDAESALCAIGAIEPPCYDPAHVQEEER